MSLMNRHLMPFVAVPILGALALLAAVAWLTVDHLRSHTAAIVIRGGTQRGVAEPAVVDERYARAFATTLVSLRTNWTAATYMERMRQVVGLFDADGKRALQRSVANTFDPVKHLNQSKTGEVTSCQVISVGPGVWEATVQAEVRTYYGSFVGGLERFVCTVHMRQVPLAPPNPYILEATALDEKVLERRTERLTNDTSQATAAPVPTPSPSQPPSNPSPTLPSTTEAAP